METQRIVSWARQRHDDAWRIGLPRAAAVLAIEEGIGDPDAWVKLRMPPGSRLLATRNEVAAALLLYADEHAQANELELRVKSSAKVLVCFYDLKRARFDSVFLRMLVRA
jgi:hypothetical protein